jgi:hypothetical protein
VLRCFFTNVSRWERLWTWRKSYELTKAGDTEPSVNAAYVAPQLWGAIAGCAPEPIAEMRVRE